MHRTKTAAEEAADRRAAEAVPRTRTVAEEEADRKSAEAVPRTKTAVVEEADRKAAEAVPVLRTRTVVVEEADRRAVPVLRTKTAVVEGAAEAVLQTKTTLEPEADVLLLTCFRRSKTPHFQVKVGRHTSSPFYLHAYLSLLYFNFKNNSMIHLVKDTMSRVENNLIWVKSVRDAAFAWWLNAIALIVVVGSFGFFLYSSYGTAVPDELKSIPFEPRTWNNAVRNVPLTEYGQLPKTETGHGLQGLPYRSSAVPF